MPRSAQESSFGRRSGEASLRVAGAAVVPFKRGAGGVIMMVVMVMLCYW